MFSARTTWHQAPNRLSELIDRMRREGCPIIDLTASLPTSCGIEYPEAAILEAFHNPAILTYEPNPRGILSAREAVMRYYDVLGQKVDPDRIFLQASTSEAYATLFKILCNAGDSVLIPRPSYPLFEYLANINDVHAVTYPLSYDGEWHIDLTALHAAVTPTTRVLVIVNPNNPTGAFLKPHELDAINVLAREHDLALIVDEVFIDYPLGDKAAGRSTAGNADALTFTLNGISKTLALPQMKLGWTAVGGPVSAVTEACA